MNSGKQNKTELLFCSSEIVAGLLLMIRPLRFVKGLIVLLGTMLLADGVLNMIRSIRGQKQESDHN